VSGAEFWLGLDDDDPVPMPVLVGERPTLGEIRADVKQARRRRAHVWTFVKVKAEAETRQTYERALVLPGLTQQQILGMLSDAAVRVGMAVFDECEKADEHRRHNASLARSAAVQARQEKRWGAAVRALLREDPTWDVAALARIIGEKKSVWKVPKPPKKREMSTFGRYVSRVKAELGIK
jgi:hypothetical protein